MRVCRWFLIKFPGAGTWLVTMLLVTNMSFGESSAQTDSADVQEVLMQLTINGQGEDDAVLLLKSVAGEWYAATDDLSRWRLRVPAESPLHHKEETFYRLKAIPGLSCTTDDVHGTVSVTAPPEAFLPTSLDDSPKHSIPLTPSKPGGFLNYDLLAERATAQTHASGLFELGSFNRMGVGVSSFEWNQTSSTRLLRLESTWTRDLPGELASLRLGDAISQSGMWGRSLRFGGIQFATNFAVQPGLVTLPLQSVSGQAALPSTVDVYVNNNLTSRTEIAPGPFSINNVPVVTGQGNVRVVVRDLLGREQIINQPFYASANLLTKGLHTFSYEIGSVRENFGLSSGDYGQGFLAATHRLGITDYLTGEVRAELEADRQTLGLGAATRMSSFGILSAALAASRGPGGSGGLISVGLERQANRLTFGIHTQLADEHFTQLGLDPHKPAARRLTNVNLGIATPASGTIGLAYVFLDDRQQPVNQLVSASYSLQLRQFGFASVSVSRALHQAGSTLIGANWTLSLGGRASTSVDVSQQQNRSEAFMEVQQGLPVGDGFGYVFRQGEHGTRDIALSAQNSIGSYSVEGATNQGETGVRLSAAGGIALLDGAHLSRRITDSFGLVEIPEFPHVRIYADNQLIGRTDDHGEALLPRLRAYERNAISIDQGDLPFDAKVGTLALDATPAFRSGAVVQFPITHAHDALISLALDDGSPLPAGAVVKIEDRAEEFPVGHDGVVYLTGLTRRNRLHGTWNDQTCDVEVLLPASTDPLPNLGTFTCSGVRP